MRSFEYRRIERAEDLSGGSMRALASFIAGGTTLLDLMKLDVMRPTQVLDINPLARFAGFGEIVVEERGAQLGSLVRMSEAADHPELRVAYPVIVQTLNLAASQQLRNMASLHSTRRTPLRRPRQPSRVL